MKLSDFRPHPQLVTQASKIYRPRFPVIDAHNHLELFGEGWENRPVADALEAMDRVGVTTLIDLDGGWGEAVLDRHLDHFKAAAPERFVVFGGVDWAAWPQHGDDFGHYAAERLKAQVARGAQGLKIWKPFGLHVRDQHGALVAVDDPRLEPLWQTAGELNIPVLVHVADPVAFFEPLDASNERLEELQAHPDWHFPSPPFPSFLSILEAFARLVERHPHTDFIGAHVGCYAENLGWVSNLLRRCPNFYIDFSARIAELGRQPYAARRFFVEFSERILFGLDGGLKPELYQLYYRFLETEDEYFNYDTSDPPSQGRWRIYGLGLPEEVLRKIYAQNAERIILHRTSKALP